MRKKITRKGIILFIILCFTFLPLRVDNFRFQITNAEWWEGGRYIVIDHDTTWKKEDDLTFKKSVVVVNGAKLTIEKGAQIKFGKETISALIIEDGTLNAQGTREEKIVFTSAEENSGFSLEFYSGPEREASLLRFVEISNGGYLYYVVAKKSIFNQALANSFASAVNYYSGKVHIENSSFKNNIYGDILDSGNFSKNDGNYLEVVNSNFEKGSDHSALRSKSTCHDHASSQKCSSPILMKNNWYGDANGPSGKIITNATNGSQVTGDATLDGWRTSDLIVDPVIIVPGIMGSAREYDLVLGDLTLDPIFHSYDNLILSFKKNGYEKNKNLFEFPYEWRDSNLITADLLKNKIQEVKNETEISKVDLVAHSMGGLVARNYIESAGYQNDVDQLVALGTPNEGSPKAYLRWEAGEGFFSGDERVAKIVFQMEAFHNGYTNLGKYIREKVPSVKELLPDYDYLKNASSGNIKNYPTGYPKNDFLDNLNDQNNLNNLSKVNFTNIIGDTGNSKGTIKSFKVKDSTVSGSWEHGMPENFYDASTDQGIEYGHGDETVPVSSADGITADKKITLNSTHGDLPTKAQCKVIEELTGKTPCQYITDFERIRNVLTFGVFSPVDIQVQAPDGKLIGKDFKNNTAINQLSDSGAFYSGYNTPNEFITIPNPTDGEYKIIAEGTGNGDYKIETSKISEDAVTGVAQESIADITGTAVTGKQETKIVTLAGDTVTTDDKDTNLPEIKITSPENNKNYLNNQILNITFTTADNKSTPDKIKTAMFLDGNKIDKNQVDLSLQILGTHKIKITAVDEAGNKSEKEISFTTSASISSIIANTNHYFDLGLIKNKTEKNALLAEFGVIKTLIDLLEKIQSYPMGKQAKAIITKEMNLLINRQIDTAITFIQNKNILKTVDQKVKNWMVEDLRSLNDK